MIAPEHRVRRSDLNRLAPRDTAWLAGLLCVWLVAMGLSVERASSGALAWLPASLRSAADSESNPSVLGRWPAASASGVDLDSGDELLRVDDRSLRGRGVAWSTLAILSAADDERVVRIRTARAGVEAESEVVLVPWSLPWQQVALSAVFAAIAVAAFRRVAGVPGARLGAAALVSLALTHAAFWGGSWAQSLASLAVIGLSNGLWAPLALVALLQVRGRPLPAAVWLAPWVLALSGLDAISRGFDWPFGAATGLRLDGVLQPVQAVSVAAVALVSYREADPALRRWLRWVLFGLVVVASPFAVGFLLEGLLGLLAWDPVAPEFWWLAWMEDAAATLSLVLPLCLLVAVVRLRLADIDRLISATLSYGVLAIVLLVGLMAVLPGASRAAAATLDLDLRATQLFMAVGMTLALVPFDQRLRERFDRWLFPERNALEEGAQRLLRDLVAGDDPDELLALAGRRLHALLRPQGMRVDRRRSGHLTPLWAIGAVEALPALDPEMLTATLAQHRGPVERGDAVFVPIQVDDTVEGALILGPRDSGDPYTTTDLALLGSVGEKLAGEWLRLRDRAEIERGRARAERLRAQKELADRENVAKSRFLAAASHDLRQPLHALGLFVETLGRRLRDGEHRDLVDRIQRSTRSLEEMMSELLDLSKLDAGAVEPSVAVVDVGPLLERVVLDLAPLAEEKGLRLRARPSRLLARSDAVLLGRIVQNLVSNALRYTDRGGVLVAARRRGSAVRIEVRDSGRGIPEDQQETIFHEFQQLERDAADGGPGLGLGLSIVDRLARLLDHAVEVASTPGQGSVFAVNVPSAPVDSTDAARPPASGSSLATDSLLRDRRVWVVDDDGMIRDAMRRLLEDWGCSVTVAASLEELRRFLESDAVGPDLLVTDYQLADETGAEVIEAVRASVGRAVPSLLITGDTTPERVGEIRATGHPILNKPVSPARLRATLMQMARKLDAGR